MAYVITDLVTRVREYLDSTGWSYSSTPQGFTLNFNLKNELSECRMEIGFITYKATPHRFTGRTTVWSPLTITADQYTRILECITRANCALPDGYFSLIQDQDHETHRIACQTFLYCEDALPELTDIESSVDFPLTLMEHFGDAFVHVLRDGADPGTELQKLEEE